MSKNQKSLVKSSRSKSTLSPSQISGIDSPTIMDSPSRIDLDSADLPYTQRFNVPIAIKDGIKKKKVRPVYKFETAPVYDPVKERAALETSIVEEPKDDDEGSGASMKAGEGEGDKKAGRGADEAEGMSPVAATLTIVGAIVSLLIGVSSFCGCLALILVKKF